MRTSKLGSYMGQNFRRAFQRFSDATSMHGFHELCYAKTWLWMIIWTLIITVAICATLYQVYLAIWEYIYQSNKTLIDAVEKEDVLYPPLKLCVQHWVSWVNWTAAYEMGFTKESVLFAASRLSNIFSSNYFDKKEANKTLTDGMSANKIPNITMFFKTIAKSSSYYTGWQTDTESARIETISPLMFDNTEFSRSLQYCYVMTTKEIVSNIEHQNLIRIELGVLTTQLNKLQVITYPQEYNLSSNEITLREYNSYIAQWIQEHTPYFTDEYDVRYLTKNYTDVYMPLVIYVDGFTENGVSIDPAVDTYHFIVKSSAHRWKNTVNKPCVQGMRSMISDRSCSARCGEWAYAKACGCVWFGGAPLLNSTDAELCSFLTYFFEENDEQEYALEPYCNFDTTVFKQYVNNCFTGCVEGCETWSYDISMTTRSVHPSVRDVSKTLYSEIIIEYPIDGSTFIMIETDGQSWEGFIGNVGGLLGIWTGASILSLFQIVYLCCCDGSDDPFVSHWWQRFRINNQRKTSNFVKRRKRIHTVTLNQKKGSRKMQTADLQKAEQSRTPSRTHDRKQSVM